MLQRKAHDGALRATAAVARHRSLRRRLTRRAARRPASTTKRFARSFTPASAVRASALCSRIPRRAPRHRRRSRRPAREGIAIVTGSTTVDVRRSADDDDPGRRNAGERSVSLSVPRWGRGHRPLSAGRRRNGVALTTHSGAGRPTTSRQAVIWDGLPGATTTSSCTSWRGLTAAPSDGAIVAWAIDHRRINSTPTPTTDGPITGRRCSRRRRPRRVEPHRRQPRAARWGRSQRSARFDHKAVQAGATHVFVLEDQRPGIMPCSWTVRVLRRRSSSPAIVS